MAYLHQGGTTLHYRAEGNGTPVVALHGSASSGAQWRSLAGYLAGRFRVVTPDLPGSGASPRASGVSLADDAEAVAALIAAIGGPVHLVGHSYGGAVALKLATIRPEALRSLTVIEPTAIHLLRQGTQSHWQLYREVSSLAGHVFAQSHAGDGEAAMRGFVDYWVGAGAWARSSFALRTALLARLPRVCADLRAVTFENAPLADLARIDVPALAVSGLLSPVPSVRVTEMVARALPRATLRRIADAGHLAPLTDPHVVDPMIAAHLLAADRRGHPAGAIAA